MQLKTFQAKTMTDALAKVKTDLGGGAMILHTRSIKRGGLLGIGARTFVEITATADPRNNGPRKTIDAVVANPQSEVQNPQSPQPPAPRPVEPTASDPALKRELSEIRTMVGDLLRRRNMAVAPPPSDLPAELIEYYSRLMSQQVAQELVAKLIERVGGGLPESASYWDAHGRLVKPPSMSDEHIREALARHLAEMLPPAAPLELTAEGRPTIVALVGPTGVGKTTTLAKLAAHMKLREHRRVGLITIDTFRIAAVEQLKTYAQILEIPLIAVTTPAEIQDAAKQLCACDLILIDTAGRSPRDEPRIAELAELVGAVRPDQVHLVLSTTSREETIREAVDKFAILGPRQVIFTKLDEAVGFGVIVNVLHDLNLRLSYLTTGQSVPDDIEVASTRRVAQLILGDDATSTEDAIRDPLKSQVSNPKPQAYEALA